MATTKMWMVKHIAGRPGFSSKVYVNGPYTRRAAVADAERIHPHWRVWVEHGATGERIFESEGERLFRAQEPSPTLHGSDEKEEGR